MPDIFPGREQEPSFDDIRRSDAFIDALATGRPAAPADASDAALAALLSGWRDEMRFPPATGLISEPQAIAALSAGLAEKPGRTVRERRAPSQRHTAERSRRGLSVVGAAAAAVLGIGGFGAVVAGSGPGDALYGMRTMMFGAPREVRDDQVALAARTEMQQVQELISQGDWQQAQEKLVAVSTQVESIGDVTQKEELLAQFNDLSAKVVERDPAATAPPGIIYTVPPSATELVPAVAPPTTPSETSAAASTSASAETSSATTAPSTSGSTSADASTSAPTTPSTSAGATSGAPTSSAAPSTSARPSTPTSASTAASTPASSAQQSAVSTPSSAAPSTSAAPSAQSGTAATTTAAPRSVTTTTSPPAPAQAVTTTAPAQTADQTADQAEATAEQEATQQEATQQEVTQQEVTQQTPEAVEDSPATSEAPAAVVTTTVPAPEG